MKGAIRRPTDRAKKPKVDEPRPRPRLARAGTGRGKRSTLDGIDLRGKKALGDKGKGSRTGDAPGGKTGEKGSVGRRPGTALDGVNLRQERPSADRNAQPGSAGKPEWIDTLRDPAKRREARPTKGRGVLRWSDEPSASDGSGKEDPSKPFSTLADKLRSEAKRDSRGAIAPRKHVTVEQQATFAQARSEPAGATSGSPGKHRSTEAEIAKVGREGRLRSKTGTWAEKKRRQPESGGSPALQTTDRGAGDKRAVAGSDSKAVGADRGSDRTATSDPGTAAIDGLLAMAGNLAQALLGSPGDRPVAKSEAAKDKDAVAGPRNPQELQDARARLADKYGKVIEDPRSRWEAFERFQKEDAALIKRYVTNAAKSLAGKMGSNITDIHAKGEEIWGTVHSTTRVPVWEDSPFGVVGTRVKGWKEEPTSVKTRLYKFDHHTETLQVRTQFERDAIQSEGLGPIEYISLVRLGAALSSSVVKALVKQRGAPAVKSFADGTGATGRPGSVADDAAKATSRGAAKLSDDAAKATSRGAAKLSDDAAKAGKSQDIGPNASAVKLAKAKSGPGATTADNVAKQAKTKVEWGPTVDKVDKAAKAAPKAAAKATGDKAAKAAPKAAAKATGDKAAKAAPKGDADVDAAIEAARGGKLRSDVVMRMDIDEPLAVSRGGAWDDPANKAFSERFTNQATKKDLLSTAPTPQKPSISLAQAAKEGDAAFQKSAADMLTRPFSEVAELDTITRQARGAMQSLNRPTRDLANSLNRSIRARIASGSSPEAQLVQRALRVMGIDPATLAQMP
jgi:hypothetical protein